MRIDACKRGHKRTDANTFWQRKPNGRLYPICKQCRADQSRLKYRNDPAFREAEKLRCLARHHRHPE